MNTNTPTHHGIHGGGIPLDFHRFLGTVRHCQHETRSRKEIKINPTTKIIYQRWDHVRNQRRAQRMTLNALTRELQSGGVDVSLYQVRRADKEPFYFARLCEGTPGYLRVIIDMFGEPTSEGA